MNLNGKATNPGEMRTRVTLQKRTVTTGTGGFQQETWSTVATVWAKWINVHGSEAWNAAAREAVEPATVTIRWRSDVDLTCRILKGSAGYQIVSIDNIQERNEYLECKVQRIAEG